MAVFHSEIASANAGKLRRLWEFRTHSYVTARPLLDRNRVYLSDWQGFIYCLDASDGKLIYEKQLYRPPRGNPVFRSLPLVNRFLSEPLPYLWNGFAGTGCLNGGVWYLASVGGKEGGALTNGSPGKLYAVYAENGTIFWERPLGDETYTGSLAVPLCVGDLLYVGLCSVDEIASVAYRLRFRSFTPQCVGEVFCFHKYSGKLIWHKKVTELIPGDDPAAKGAGVWGGFSADTLTGALHFATGNSYGRPVSKASDSVICVGSGDGRLRWSFQAQAQDAWMPLKRDGPDFDFGCTPIPFPCSAAASGYAVGAGNKNGTVYALDSLSGIQVWAAYCHIHSTPDDGIRSNITFLDGRIYVWSKNETPADSISVNCLDAETGTVLWNRIEPGTNCMTTGAVTNDLFFMADYSGRIYALRLGDGIRVWESAAARASYGSDLVIRNSAVYAGFGVPRLFGGKYSAGGVVCWGL